jgi:hypothetical protein
MKRWRPKPAAQPTCARPGNAPRLHARLRVPAKCERGSCCSVRALVAAFALPLLPPAPLDATRRALECFFWLRSAHCQSHSINAA